MWITEQYRVSANCILNSIFKSCTYILQVGSSKECFLVDCGDVEKIIDLGWNVRGVFLTHSHFDHIYGLNQLIQKFPKALIYTNPAGKEGLVNDRWNFSRYHTEVENFVFSKIENVRILEEGVNIIEELQIYVLFTPGHDPSCISYIIDNNLYTGDAYIPGLEPFQKFPRSNKDQALKSMNLLKELLRTHQYNICPGHLSNQKE